MTRKKKEAENQKPASLSPYTFVAYVAGPVYEFEVSANDFDEAYRVAMESLGKALKRYKGNVRIDRIELSTISDYF